MPTREGYLMGPLSRPLDYLDATVPAPMNGRIVIRKVRVTVEQVEEPLEVLQARLVDLWETTPHNMHLTPAFAAEATKLGVTLPNATRASRKPK